MTSNTEIILYNLDGKQAAYIATDKENTIYLMSGEAVAYVKNDQIIGINGKFIGNFKNGVVTNSSGVRIGAIESEHRGGKQAPAGKMTRKMVPSKQMPDAHTGHSEVDDVILNPQSLTQNLKSGIPGRR
mgnify:CR=1 FL=1|jgi:hypothetical protein